MAVTPPAGDPADSPALAPLMAEAIRHAWSSGTLVLPLRDAHHPARLPGYSKHSLPRDFTGEARVVLAGVGETFAAWVLRPHGRPPLTVRIPWRSPREPAPALLQEMAALTKLPPGLGPEPVVVRPTPEESPFGMPYLVTTFVPGSVLDPADWGAAHLGAHARALARLHTVSAPGRGRLTLAADPWEGTRPGPLDLPAEVAAAWAWWRDEAPEAIREHRLEPFLDAALAVVESASPELATVDHFVLAHGDLCATNVVWGPEGGVRYIDLEWAQGDDPARDLAILGGAVHGGPWYLPLGDDQVRGFVDRYVAERRRLADTLSRADAAGGEVTGPPLEEPEVLLRRMRAWTAYERTGMLVHVARRAPRSDVHTRALPELRATLGAWLGLSG